VVGLNPIGIPSFIGSSPFTHDFLVGGFNPSEKY
jgi:hypothetical protein